MIKIIKIYFLKKQLARLIKQATQAIYSEQFDLNELTKILNSNKNIDLLKTYIAVQVATGLVLPLEKNEIDKALEVFLSFKKMLQYSEECENILELHKFKAEKNLLKLKIDFVIGKIAFEANEFSYEGIIYKAEKI